MFVESDPDQGRKDQVNAMELLHPAKIFQQESKPFMIQRKIQSLQNYCRKKTRTRALCSACSCLPTSRPEISETSSDTVEGLWMCALLESAADIAHDLQKESPTLSLTASMQYQRLWN
ncbi:uncharacterized protein LOC142344798 isoform X2 [Convolutriloba macropyga]|uniref:uncharacterized protein LOC142344798 isoform X2 n=1 Tax=Convolutriloba macropyga TaxID=536237 RepID=UPI003F5216F8